MKFLISSVSCANIGISLTFCKRNSKETFNGYREIFESFKKLKIGDLRLSLLSGLNTSSYIMHQLCQANNYQIGCGDVPDENWNFSRFGYDLKMIWLELKNSRISFLEKIKLFVAQMFVWRLFGVWNKKLLKMKIEEMLEVTEIIDGKKYLRWDSRGLTENEKILNMLPKNVILLVEYYPESGQTPDQFWEYLVLLNKKYEICIKGSFDPVHYWRAKNFFPEFGFNPEEMLERIINNEEWIEIMSMLEISNVFKESTQAHSSVLYGEIDFISIFDILAKANKKSLLKQPFFVVFEFNPTKRDVFHNEIEKFILEITESFDK